jgi:hypothetical protein
MMRVRRPIQRSRASGSPPRGRLHKFPYTGGGSSCGSFIWRSVRLTHGALRRYPVREPLHEVQTKRHRPSRNVSHPCITYSPGAMKSYDFRHDHTLRRSDTVTLFSRSDQGVGGKARFPPNLTSELVHQVYICLQQTLTAAPHTASETSKTQPLEGKPDPQPLLEST